MMACNYDEAATEENNSCTYAEDSALNAQYETVVFDYDGNCMNDTDGDGVCDEFETSGCTDSTVCNFNSSATDDGTCTYPETLTVKVTVLKRRPLWCLQEITHLYHLLYSFQNMQRVLQN